MARFMFEPAVSSVWDLLQLFKEKGNLFLKEINGFVLYYIHLEITGDPCNLIGSERCDLFTNRTILCSKSHLFFNQ